MASASPGGWIDVAAIEMTTGAWVYRLGCRCAADFIALLDQGLQAFSRAPVIAVICDNDSIHHARTVTAYLKEHPRLEVPVRRPLQPHDNPAERIWAALTGPDAGYRRTLDQPLATSGLRAELLECRLDQTEMMALRMRMTMLHVMRSR